MMAAVKMKFSQRAASVFRFGFADAVGGNPKWSHTGGQNLISYRAPELVSTKLSSCCFLVFVRIQSMAYEYPAL